MNKKWNLEKVKEYINKYDCELISKEYYSTSEKLEIKCSCGNSFKSTFNNFRNSKHKCCKKCASSKGNLVNLKTNDVFLKEVFKLVGDEYTFIDEYKSAKTKIKVMHNTCGHIYEVSPDKFLGGRRCPKCNGGSKLTQSMFVKKVSELFGDEYTVIGEYKSNHTNVTIRHNCCGNEFDVLPLNFLRYMSGCHKCNCSKGENKIQSVLDELKLTYEMQYTFDKLRGEKNRPFPFDFVVFFENKIVAIEFDGEQHFKSIEHFGGIGKLKKQKIADEKKNIFCYENGIELLRIPYFEYNNIEIILREALL